MDKFEQQFETLDVQTAQMEDTMGNTTTISTPQVLHAANHFDFHSFEPEIFTYTKVCRHLMV